MPRRRPDTPPEAAAAEPALAISRDAEERERLFSTIAALSGGEADVDTLVAFRNRTRLRPWGHRVLAAPAERRSSPGRRLSDIVRDLDVVR